MSHQFLFPFSWMVVSSIWIIFTPNLGEMIQFDDHIFQTGGSTTNQFLIQTPRWKICDRFDDTAPVFAYAPVSDFGHAWPSGEVCLVSRGVWWGRFGAGEKFILSPGSKWFMYVGWVSKVFLLISILQSWVGMIPFDWHIFIIWIGLTIG